MGKFINRLSILLLSSMVFGVSGFAGLDPNFFIIKVQTDNVGISTDTQFTIPTDSLYTYYYNVDCDGNGNDEAINQDGNYTCLYTSSGTKTIAISGTFPAIYFNNEGDKKKILEVIHWGTREWESMKKAFKGASNLTVTALDNPDLSRVTDMSYMFMNTEAFDQDIGDWNVSNVTNMDGMFYRAEAFNQDIGDWNVSGVTNMVGMFAYALTFNHNIGKWNVSNVINMSGMFHHAVAFNKDIGDWNVSNVITMSYMFAETNTFNQDIGDWNVSTVFYMTNMFHNANAFNQDIGDWDVSRVQSMSQMFEGAHPVSISNYDNLLYSWEKLNLQSNVDFHAGLDTHYCDKAWSKQYIQEDYSWDITDGSIDCDFYIITPNKVTVKSGETAVFMNVNANIDEGEDTYHHIVENIADWNKFEMNLYGELKFKLAPNANNPTDKNADNI